MNSRRIATTLTALALCAALAGCWKTKTVSGTEFNYDNHAKIQKGTTTRNEVKALLEGSPVGNGTEGDLTWDKYHYTYSESEAMSGYMPRMGSAGGRSDTNTSWFQVIAYFDENDVCVRISATCEDNRTTTKSGAAAMVPKDQDKKLDAKHDAAKAKRDEKIEQGAAKMDKSDPAEAPAPEGGTR